VLHPDDATNKVFIAIGRAFLSVVSTRFAHFPICATVFGGGPLHSARHCREARRARFARQHLSVPKWLVSCLHAHPPIPLFSIHVAVTLVPSIYLE
jgi:hypothetical protein